jgi:hypothetical protein
MVLEAVWAVGQRSEANQGGRTTVAVQAASSLPPLYLPTSSRSASQNGRPFWRIRLAAVSTS